MEDELWYTENAEISRYLFYSDLNDVHIIVEDKDKEYEYETILNKLFCGEYKITSIISANGKEGVKKAFRELGEKDQENPSKNNIYIVDGDFDRYIYSEDMIRNDHFIYLEKYNIENYLIDEQAIIKFAKGKIHLLDDQVKAIVDFSHWYLTIIEQAKKLFLLYCAVQNVLPTIENVARNEYLFIDHKTGFERADGYKIYYDEIAALKTDIDLDIESIKGIYEEINGNDYSGLICGKFLLTSLFVYLEGKTKRNFYKDELRWSLICDINCSKLEFLKNRVDFLCKN